MPLSDVPPEVQALHINLFERYLGVLIKRADFCSSHIDFEKLCARIERLLSLDGTTLPGRAEYVYLTAKDFDALEEFKITTREILGDPVTYEEYDDGPPATSEKSSEVQEPVRMARADLKSSMTPEEEMAWMSAMRGTPADEPRGRDETPSVLHEVQEQSGHGDEPTADDGLAGSDDVDLPVVQPARHLGAAPSSDYASGRAFAPVIESVEIRAAKKRGVTETEIDAAWEQHPELTRGQAALRLRKGLLESAV